MLRAMPTTYDEFKSAFDALGGSRKTTVVFKSQTGDFRIVAAFPSENIALGAGFAAAISTTPSTLAADFPQAVAVSNLEIT